MKEQRTTRIEEEIEKKQERNKTKKVKERETYKNRQ